MRYFEDMLDKNGFGDGETEPAGAEKYREVYVRAINAFAQEHGSVLRAYPYNRPGYHNSCMIVFAPEGKENDSNGTYAGPMEDICQPDEPMSFAIDQAMGLALDAWVITKTKIQPTFERYIRTGRIFEEAKGTLSET